MLYRIYPACWVLFLVLFFVCSFFPFVLREVLSVFLFEEFE